MQDKKIGISDSHFLHPSYQVYPPLFGLGHGLGHDLDKINRIAKLCYLFS